MATKAKLDRVEHPDLSGYLTTGHYNQLVSMINGANAAAAAAAASAVAASRAAEVKSGTASSAGKVKAGTYSHNLASITGASGSDWVFSMSVSSTGATNATQGYGKTVVGTPSVSGSVSGSTGTVVVSSPAVSGYRAVAGTLSYTLTATARHP